VIVLLESSGGLNQVKGFRLVRLMRLMKMLRLLRGNRVFARMESRFAINYGCDPLAASRSLRVA